MADLTFTTEAGAVDVSVETQADLSAAQYFFIKLSTAELGVLAGANEKTLGILQNAPVGTATEPAIARVRVSGISKLKIAETVAFGKFLTPTAAGDGEVCDAAGEEYGARALTSGEDNDLITVEVCHGEVEATDA